MTQFNINAPIKEKIKIDITKGYKVAEVAARNHVSFKAVWMVQEEMDKESKK